MVQIHSPPKFLKYKEIKYFMVRLRLKRLGRKKRPIYRVIAIDSRCHREGSVLKEVGFYNPLTDETRLDVQQILAYLKTGAQPSQTVKNILTKARIYEQLSSKAN